MPMPQVLIPGVRAQWVMCAPVMQVLTLGTTMPQAQILPTCSSPLPSGCSLPQCGCRGCPPPFAPHHSQLLPHGRGCLRAAPARCQGRAGSGSLAPSTHLAARVPQLGHPKNVPSVPAPWLAAPIAHHSTRVTHPCPPPGTQGAGGATCPHLPQHPGAAGRSRSRQLDPGGARQLRVRLGNPHGYRQWTFVLL